MAQTHTQATTTAVVEFRISRCRYDRIAEKIGELRKTLIKGIPRESLRLDSLRAVYDIPGDPETITGFAVTVFPAGALALDDASAVQRRLERVIVNSCQALWCSDLEAVERPSNGENTSPVQPKIMVNGNEFSPKHFKAVEGNRVSGSTSTKTAPKNTVQIDVTRGRIRAGAKTWLVPAGEIAECIQEEITGFLETVPSQIEGTHYLDATENRQLIAALEQCVTRAKRIFDDPLYNLLSRD